MPSKEERRKVRNEFKSRKKSGRIYRELGVEKDANRSLHHGKSIKDGGKNNWQNIWYLLAVIHDFFHRFERNGDIPSSIEWGKNRAPGAKESWNKIGDALTDQAIKNENAKAVKSEMEYRR